MLKATRRRSGVPRPVATPEQQGEGDDLRRDVGAGRDASAVALCGGDLDADLDRAAASGEEAVGGTVATPDQDVVDEIGRALGVEQAADAPVVTSAEILNARDRHYWHLERQAAEAEDR